MIVGRERDEVHGQAKDDQEGAYVCETIHRTCIIHIFTELAEVNFITESIDQSARGVLVDAESCEVETIVVKKPEVPLNDLLLADGLDHDVDDDGHGAEEGYAEPSHVEDVREDHEQTSEHPSANGRLEVGKEVFPGETCGKEAEREEDDGVYAHGDSKDQENDLNILQPWYCDVEEAIKDSIYC